ncbi:MAG: LysR family transcriptional regulator [Burkholderiales bacterium]
MNITSRQLKAFLLTAQLHSFSRAAEQLFITQSGISVLIRRLEEQLGFPLFERTTRSVSLTAFGSQFLPIANRNLLELDGAAVSIGRSATAAKQRLTIGANPLMAKMFLPSAIKEYAKREPHQEVILHDGYRNQLVTGVIAGEIDLALGSFLHSVPGLRRRLLHQFALVLVEPRTEIATRLRNPRWEDLIGQRLLGEPPDNFIQQLTDRQLRRVGRIDPPEMRFHFFETHIAMVEAGAGVAVLPSFCYPACRDRNVTVSELTDPVVPVDFYEITSRARRLPSAAEGFSAFLTTYIADWAKGCSPTLANAA